MDEDDYTVELVARQEGIRYRSRGALHHFDVALVGDEWQLFLPGSRGETFAPHELTAAEEAEILPRIVAHLETDRVLGVVVARYRVRIVRRPT